MARIEWIEQRLQNWARWHLARGGDGPTGFASVDLGVAPTPTRGEYASVTAVPFTSVEAAETDAALALLYPSGLRLTVFEVYVGRGGLAEKAARLACSVKTIHARVDQAHHQLAEHFLARNDRLRRERDRLQALLEGGGVPPGRGFTP